MRGIKAFGPVHPTLGTAGAPICVLFKGYNYVIIVTLILILLLAILILIVLILIILRTLNARLRSGLLASCKNSPATVYSSTFDLRGSFWFAVPLFPRWHPN